MTVNNPSAADIYINTPVNRSFTYKIPSDMKLIPGMRVMVQFCREKNDRIRFCHTQ